jgi:hypothetical protein
MSYENACVASVLKLKISIHVGFFFGYRIIHSRKTQTLVPVHKRNASKQKKKNLYIEHAWLHTIHNITTHTLKRLHAFYTDIINSPRFLLNQ